jgi:hypothetical protein
MPFGRFDDGAQLFIVDEGECFLIVVIHKLNTERQII